MQLEVTAVIERRLSRPDARNLGVLPVLVCNREGSEKIWGVEGGGGGGGGGGGETSIPRVAAWGQVGTFVVKTNHSDFGIWAVVQLLP